MAHVYSKANEIRNEARVILSNEKAGILREARENGIDPKEIGMNESSSIDDDDTDSNNDSSPTPPHLTLRNHKKRNTSISTSKNESESDSKGCLLI